MATRKISISLTITAFLLLTTIGCNKRTLNTKSSKGTDLQTSITYLALGDSYTIGERVAAKDNFPSQLRSKLKKNDIAVDLEIIATTGWRTDELLNALDKRKTNPPYDLVTLLIGVNNQYQDKPFATYEKEFKELFKRALELAGGETKNLIIISIPDWSYTLFGQSSGRENVSKEIDRYNAYAEEVAQKNSVKFLNITDITRHGLKNPDLVASDNLHPSALAYKMFVERLAPIVISELKN